MNFELDFKSGIGRKQKMSDLEVVALSLTAEFMSIDSENSLFKLLLPSEIPNLIERSQFNKRRKKLFLFSEEVRTKLACKFLEFEDYFVVDSMPLEICKFSRHNRIKICKDEILKQHLPKVSVLLKTIGSSDINFMVFVLFLVFFIR